MEYGSVVSEKLLRGSELAVVMEPFVCPGAYIIIGGDLTSNPTPSSAGHVPPLILCSKLESKGGRMYTICSWPLSKAESSVGRLLSLSMGFPRLLSPAIRPSAVVVLKERCGIPLP